MKKSHQIFFIGLVITLSVIVAIGVYFYQGQDYRNSHFIRIELNPKVEFLTDNDNIVNTIYPVNEDASLIIAGEEFVGLNITEAVSKFLDLSAKMGYLDVNNEDNGVQVSVSSGFMQSLENKIYKACNDYFLDNEIMCVIAESDADLKLYNDKKEKNVISIEKLVVINSILEKTQEFTFEELDNKNESELLEILEDLHNNKKLEIENPKEEIIYKKQMIIAENKEKYENHKAKITNETKREFSSKYSKYKKSKTYDYELDFQKKMEENKNKKM